MSIDDLTYADCTNTTLATASDLLDEQDLLLGRMGEAHDYLPDFLPARPQEPLTICFGQPTYAARRTG